MESFRMIISRIVFFLTVQVFMSKLLSPEIVQSITPPAGSVNKEVCG